MVRSLAKLKEAFKKVNGLKAQDFFDLIDTVVDKAILNLVASDVGLGTTSDPTFASVTIDKLALLEQSGPPDDPIGGKAYLYFSDGTVSDESAGDLIYLVSSPAGSGAVTKKIVIADFSAA